MRKNQLILPMFSFLILFLFLQCSKNENNGVLDKQNPENETDIEINNPPEGVSISFIRSAPWADVNKESLPELLVIRINEYEDFLDPGNCVKFLRGSWNNRTVYYIFESYSSCMACKIYYEDGHKIEFANSKIITDFYNTSTNWVIFREFGTCYF